MGAADAVQLYQLQLSVTAAVTPLAGDYNNDGIVDTADYVLWRKTAGTPGDYSTWRQHFAEAQSGAGGVTTNIAGVPEPHSIAWLVIAIAYVIPLRGPRHGTQQLTPSPSGRGSG
jgi:hypothetical protein